MHTYLLRTCNYVVGCCISNTVGPTKPPARDRDSHQPSQRKRLPNQPQTDDRHSVKKDSDFSEATGRPAHGYTEVFDIESGSDWEDVPLIEADPKLTVPQRAMEGQPLLPTPPIEKRTYDNTRQHEGDVYVNHHSHRGDASHQKRQFRNRETEMDDQFQEPPYQDLRDKIRGSTSGRGRGKAHDPRREKKGFSESLKGEGRQQHRPQPPSAHIEPKHSDRIIGVLESDKNVPKELPKSRQRLLQGPKDNKLDAIPPPDSPVTQPLPSKADFGKYDLNSHKVAIIDDILEDGRLSPSSQAEFVEVTSKKTQKEKQRKEKEEQRKQEEEKRREDEKRKRKVASSKPADKAPPSDNKPYTAWSTSNVTPESSDGLWGVTVLPVGSPAPGSQLNKPITSTDSLLHTWSIAPPIGFIGDSLLHKQAVPHTAELMSTVTPMQDQNYSLFGNGLHFYQTPYPTVGILDAAIDSTVPVVSPTGMKEDIKPAEDISNNSTPDASEEVIVETKPAVKGKKEDNERQKSDVPRSAKNLPPRLKSQQSGSGPSGRGRGNRHAHSRDVGSGGERKERRVGRQAHGDKSDKQQPAHKERAQEERTQSKVRNGNTFT